MRVNAKKCLVIFNGVASWEGALRVPWQCRDSAAFCECCMWMQAVASKSMPLICIVLHCIVLCWLCCSVDAAACLVEEDWRCLFCLYVLPVFVVCLYVCMRVRVCSAGLCWYVPSGLCVLLSLFCHMGRAFTAGTEYTTVTTETKARHKIKTKQNKNT